MYAVCIYKGCARVHVVYVGADGTECPGQGRREGRSKKKNIYIYRGKNIRPSANANVKFSRGFLIVIGRSLVATAPTYSICFPFCLCHCVSRYISPSAEPARLRSEMPHDACIYNIVARLSGFFFLGLPALTLISSRGQSL